MNTHIYWHIVEINHWYAVVCEQYEWLKDSGLLEHATQINVTFLGSKKENIDFLLAKNKKFYLDCYSSELRNCEQLALHSMSVKANSSEEDFYIFYFHVKGVTRPHNMKVHCWRHVMQHHLITNFQWCIAALDEYDVYNWTSTKKEKYNLAQQECKRDKNICSWEANTSFFKYDIIGCYLHGNHFSGNFWWTKASYVRRLPKYEKISEDDPEMHHPRARFRCESWPLSAPERKLLEIRKDPRGLVHFYQDFPIL